jgi:hypothetical protein
MVAILKKRTEGQCARDWGSRIATPVCLLRAALNRFQEFITGVSDRPIVAAHIPESEVHLSQNGKYDCPSRTRQ